MIGRLAALCLLLPAAASAQGFAGLGDAAEGFVPVTPGRAFAFPEDHAPHPGFRIEWWYVTANLEGPDGTPYGVQWTLFRSALTPDPAEDGWSAPQIWMAHAAASGPGVHHAAEKFGRGGVGQAGVALGPFRAWLDDWRLASLGTGEDAPWSPLRMTADGDGFAFDLTLTAEGPEVLQGDAGWSRKSEREQASYYYSNPFLAVEGRLTLEGREIPVTGRGWMDREWSSQPLDADQTGWDWFSLHLPAGEKLMVYRLRHADGRDWHASTWIGADGSVTPLTGDAIEMRPLEWDEDAEGRRAPVAWEIAIPSRGLRITTTPMNPRSWMGLTIDYWEGPVRFEGSHAGVGYLEMTGY